MHHHVSVCATIIPIMKDNFSMLKFSNLLEYIILLIYSEKESNQPGLEDRKVTPYISLLDTTN